MDQDPSPQSLLESANSAYKQQNYPLAAQHYQQAALSFQSAGQTLFAAELWNNASVAYLKGGNPDQAYQSSLGTNQTFALAGDSQKQAVALANQAAALEAKHKINEALILYLQSNQILKQLNDQEFRPYVLQSITALQLRTGHPLEALLTSEVALDLKKNLALRERVLKRLLATASKLLGQR